MSEQLSDESQNMLSFTWSDFLALAQQWYESPNSNHPAAHYRSIISRAYYAAYHNSRTLAIGSEPEA